MFRGQTYNSSALFLLNSWGGDPAIPTPNFLQAHT